MEKDLTKGSPLKLIIMFSLPLLAGNIFQQLYAMVDTIVVGRFVGTDALAAVGSTGGFSFFVISFALGLGTGFGIIISQRFGAKDMVGMRKAFAQSIMLSLYVGLFLTIVFTLLAKPLLIMLKTPQNIIADAHKYVVIIFIGLLCSIFYNFLSAVLRAIGDSKSPLVFLIISSVLNIILDLVFVIYFHMGVAGVAVATIFSQGVSAVLSYFYITKRTNFFKFEKGDFKYDKLMCQKLLRLGLPSALQMSAIAVGIVAVQVALNSLNNSDFIAAYSVGVKIEQLLNQFYFAIGTAIATFSGQNLGALKIDRVKKGVNVCFILTVVWALISLLLSTFIAEPLAHLFIGNDGSAQNVGVIENTVLYVRLLVYFFIPLGLIIVYKNAIQGLGNGVIPLLSSVIELVLRILVAFFLIFVLKMGFVAIAYANIAAWIGAGVMLPICYFVQVKKVQKWIEKIENKEIKEFE